MIHVSPLTLLFLIQFFLIFSGSALFLLLQNKKLRKKRTEISCPGDDIEQELKQNHELAAWKDMFNALQEKFDHIRGINTGLKDSVTLLIPDAEKSKEYEKLVSNIEQSNKELDLCLGTLEKENAELEKKAASYEKQVEGLHRKMNNYVHRTEFDKLTAEKAGLEIKIKKLSDELGSVTEEFEKLEKNYMWLEKEYNALYANVNEQKAST